jgi:pimeloyl-ACP methyl ester carboxylesterase
MSVQEGWRVPSQKMPAVAEFLHPEYPWTARWLEVAGGWRLHYVDEGTGPPVLFLHGNPTWSFYFRRAIAHLQPFFRCIAMDHIGCGLSDHPSPQEYDYSLRRRIDDVEALVEYVAPGQPIALVVHDWGGMIGLGWAARHPERLAALVAMNTAAFPKPAAKRLPWGLWLARHTALGAFLVRRTRLFCRLAARWCVVRRLLPPDVHRMYLLPYRSAAQRWAVLKFVQTIPLRSTDAGYDIVEQTAACFSRWRQVPALLLWGLADFVFDRHFLEAWQRYLPQAQVQAWPDAGHYLLEDAPEEVLPVLRDFLLRHYHSLSPPEAVR